jgi:integrase/recombinase XerC
MTESKRSRPPALDGQLKALLGRLDELELSPQTRARFVELFLRFGTFIGSGHRISDLAEVGSGQVEAFIHARSAATGTEPSIATSHLRRSAMRILLREARGLSFISGDPTLDLNLPARRNVASPRPLTESEVSRCRAACLTDTRLAAAWALAEATATTAELPRAVVDDVHQGRVWLAGSTKTDARWGYFSDWGIQQIQRRLATVERKGESMLVYGGRGSPQSQQASSCIAISNVMRRAGIRSSDVRPASVRAWAARRIFEETKAIDVVARRLGLRSLDAAARIIEWKWRGDG